ncbi:hypothetical protein GmHk_03G007850 [Glycine max]|nr:hypothetical protein GmHk_03G007850 [Glycine max]
MCLFPLLPTFHTKRFWAYLWVFFTLSLDCALSEIACLSLNLPVKRDCALSELSNSFNSSSRLFLQFLY